MLGMTIREIAGVIGADTPATGSDKLIRSVSTDTRDLRPGELFFALQGDRFDAHEFARVAAEKGAAALVLTKEVAGIPSGTPVLIVSDTLKALQVLARYNRSKRNLPVIGVTGSNGKTTTKDMIASVLGVRYRVLKVRAVTITK